jgi:uncharacterized protein YecE (DUF72 family)
MALPSLLKFGTSTWAYEGWQGLVYHKPYPKGRFKKDCLAEYAQYAYRGQRLFHTVGLDQTFYRPPTPAQLTYYAAQLTSGFEVCSKVWEEITIPRYVGQERYGAKAGQTNPRFLDPTLFRDQILAPYEQVFQEFTGPFIFEFQRTGIEPKEFLQRLDQFLGALPPDYAYAVEVRNERILGPAYYDVLQRHEAGHVYNHWTYMPPLAEQHRRLASRFSAPFVLLRLLTPMRMKYEDAVTLAEPYNRIVRALPTMRTDTVKLIRQAVGEGRRVYVLVNNRAEGCAPLTVQAIVDEFLPSEIGA